MFLLTIKIVPEMDYSGKSHENNVINFLPFVFDKNYIFYILDLGIGLDDDLGSQKNIIRNGFSIQNYTEKRYYTCSYLYL